MLTPTNPEPSVDAKTSFNVSPSTVTKLRFVGATYLGDEIDNILSGLVHGSIIRVGFTNSLLDRDIYDKIVEEDGIPIQIIAERIELKYVSGSSTFELATDSSKRYIGSGKNGLVLRYVELNGVGEGRSFVVKYTDPNELKSTLQIAGASCTQVRSFPLSCTQKNTHRLKSKGPLLTSDPGTNAQIEYVALVMSLYDGDLSDISTKIEENGLLVSPEEQVNLVGLVRDGLECMFKKKLCYGDVKPANILFKISKDDPNLIGISIGDIGSDHISSFYNPFIKNRANTTELCEGSTRQQALDFLMVMFALSMFNMNLFDSIHEMLTIEVHNGGELTRVMKDNLLFLLHDEIATDMPQFRHLTQSWSID